MDLVSKNCHKEIHARMYFSILCACALQKHWYALLGPLRAKWARICTESWLETKHGVSAPQWGILGSQEVCVWNYCNQTPVPKDGCMIQLFSTASGGGNFPTSSCCPHYHQRNQDNSSYWVKIDNLLRLSPLPSLPQVSLQGHTDHQPQENKT